MSTCHLVGSLRLRIVCLYILCFRVCCVLVIVPDMCAQCYQCTVPPAELRPQCLLCQLVLPRRTRRANTCGHRTLLAAFFPILLFRQKPRAPAWFSSNRGQTRPRWTSTVTPVSSQRRCTATQLLGGLSCLICGKMLAALPKNLQKLGREKILDEKAAGAVCSPTWCTRFSAKCGHPLFTVISAACIVERPLFCRAMFVQPTSSRAWSPRNMFF